MIFSGDLVESALYQSPHIGNSGSWNNTQVPRYYFIKNDENQHYEFTDAEVRADLDGFILAKEMQNIKNKASGIKLSQILDMYYSPRGVYSPDIRACNRLNVYGNLTSVDELKNATNAFAFYYNEFVTVPSSIHPDGITQSISEKVDEFTKYLCKISTQF